MQVTLMLQGIIAYSQDALQRAVGHAARLLDK